MTDAAYYCYRLPSTVDYDHEVIAAYVQRSGGHWILRQDCWDFWVPAHARVMLICAWPDLDRCEWLDLV